MYKITIIGNIGNDAVYKDINGIRYMSFSLAHTERYKDQNNQTIEKTIWFSCLKKGESKLVHYLRKGSTVYLEGTLMHKIYIQNGTPQVGLSLNICRLELINVKDASQSSEK